MPRRGEEVKDKKLLDWAEFVATKFSKNMDGWVYSRDTGPLRHIRYESDYKGYNHWAKRARRAFDWKHLTGTDSFSKMFRKNESLKMRLYSAWAWVRVCLRKDSNLPDGMINGIITHWEEDGEYIALFQPRVGVRVIDFIRSNPDNEYARAILDEMHACKELSWPSKGTDD